MSCEAKIITQSLTPFSDENGTTTVQTEINCEFCPLQKKFITTANVEVVFCEAADTVSNYLPEGCKPRKKYQ